VGDEMVTSLYYKKWGTSEHIYVLLKDSHLVFMHSYFVCGMRLLLPPKHYQVVNGNDRVYELMKTHYLPSNFFLHLWIMTNCPIDVPISKVIE